MESKASKYGGGTYSTIQQTIAQGKKNRKQKEQWVFEEPPVLLKDLLHPEKFKKLEVDYERYRITVKGDIIIELVQGYICD